MPKGSEELTRARKEEIISACEKLYETMSFKEISIKEIGKVTSFTRTSIYNYFQTKEEIFLALLQREDEKWIEDLRHIRCGNDSMSRLDFASALAHSLEARPNLLKLMAMNHYDMEENCRMENLIEFKRVYGQSLDEMRLCLGKFFPDLDAEAFIYSFFPFMFGIYPYTTVTPKQQAAMRAAGVDYAYLSIYEITFAEIRKLLGC